MIASTTVARWTWGRHNHPGEEISACFHELFTAWSVLVKNRLVTGTPKVSALVSEAGRANSYLFEGHFEPDSMDLEVAQSLAMQVGASLLPGRVGSAYAHIEACGIIVDGAHEIHQDKTFLLGSTAFLDYVSTDLATYADAWMPYDLKGRAQPRIHAANAPRLAATLTGLSQVLRSETDPDDPTHFGQPTETGVDNLFKDDGTPWDVWSSFEIPYRHDQFTHAPGFGRIGYRRSVDGEVEYVPVLGKHGLLGYLWASDTENTASFEPRDVGDDDTYRAGLRWLERLRSAHDEGLTPSQALRRLAGLPDEDGTGVIDTSAPPRRTRLDALRDRAARP
ncbi:hypothetical protein [Streptomyces sp. NPDC088864]|uniref:hypothetical protein n=1 Tax=Streptomyces sp. NPDC088864 TaxID=3365910 RepID=UPI003803082C